MQTEAHGLEARPTVLLELVWPLASQVSAHVKMPGSGNSSSIKATTMSSSLSNDNQLTIYHTHSWGPVIPHVAFNLNRCCTILSLTQPPPPLHATQVCGWVCCLEAEQGSKVSIQIPLSMKGLGSQRVPCHCWGLECSRGQFVLHHWTLVNTSIIASSKLTWWSVCMYVCVCEREREGPGSNKLPLYTFTHFRINLMVFPWCSIGLAGMATEHSSCTEAANRSCSHGM